MLSKKILKLVFALDLVRHGDRAPAHHAPEVSTAWLEHEIGKLTERGARDAELLGKNFRDYYVTKTGLLSNHHVPDLIYARSTNMSRTKDTARAILKGFFQEDAHKINVIAPPAHEDVLNVDNYNSIHTAATEKVAADIAKSDAEFHVALAQTLKHVNQTLGTSLSSRFDAICAGDVVHVSRIHGRPISKKLSSKLAKKMLELSARSALALSASPTVACIYGKATVLHIADLLLSRPSHRYALYVAHDMNLMAVTHLLNPKSKQIHPYLSNLRFEVFEDQARHLLVKVSLDGKVMNICNDSRYCTLAQFEKQVRANVARICA